MVLYWILLLITAVIAYSFGSLSTLVLASNFVFRTNLRKIGRGNQLIVNFRRIYGLKGVGMLLAVEFVKDIIPIIVGGLLLGIKGHADVGRAFAGFCMVMGRCFPAIYRFRGSEAACTLIVSMLFVNASIGIVGIVFVFSMMYFTKYISLSVFIAALVMMVVSVLVLDDTLLVLLCVFSGLLVVIKHIPAIKRVYEKKEEKLSLREDLSYKFEEKF